MGRYAAIDFCSRITEESIVFWDIKRCPVPDGCCANRVAPCMVISGESSLDEMSSLEEEEEKKSSLDNFLRSLSERGFNIIRNLPYDCQAATSPSDLWRSVLAGLFADSTNVPYPEGVLVQKPPTCFCQVCRVYVSPFEESPFEKFISHLVKDHGQLSPEPKEHCQSSPAFKEEGAQETETELRLVRDTTTKKKRSRLLLLSWISLSCSTSSWECYIN